MKLRIRQQSHRDYLYANLNVSGIRVKKTLGISVPHGCFDSKTEQVISTPDDIEINQLIHNFRTQIKIAVRTLQNQQNLSAFAIKEEIERIKAELIDHDHSTENEVNLSSYGETHIARSSATKKAATIKQYKNCLNHLRKYEKQRRKRITFEGVDLQFYNSLLDFCYQELNF